MSLWRTLSKGEQIRMSDDNRGKQRLTDFHLRHFWKNYLISAEWKINIIEITHRSSLTYRYDIKWQRGLVGILLFFKLKKINPKPQLLILPYKCITTVSYKCNKMMYIIVSHPGMIFISMLNWMIVQVRKCTYLCECKYQLNWINQIVFSSKYLSPLNIILTLWLQ